jgi:hypothetical protein
MDSPWSPASAHDVGFSVSRMLRTIPALIGIAIVSLSIHVVMLQGLGIAHPDFSSIGLTGLLVVVGQNFALLVLYRLFRRAIPGLTPAAGVALIVFADMIVTDQFRLAVMSAVTTASLIFPAITLLASFAGSLVVALLVVATARYLRGVPTQCVGAVLITAISTFLVQPGLDRLVEPLSGLARPEIYTEPYGPGVLSVSYTLFTLTVAATFAIVAILAPSLSRRAPINLAQIMALLLSLRGMLIAQLVFPWLMRGSPATAALEISQFFLQDVVMIGLVWLLWRARFSGSILER